MLQQEHSAVIRLLPGEIPLVGYRLQGQVFNDSKKMTPDGKFIETTPIRQITATCDGLLVTTETTTYKVE